MLLFNGLKNMVEIDMKQQTIDYTKKNATTLKKYY